MTQLYGEARRFIAIEQIAVPEIAGAEYFLPGEGVAGGLDLGDFRFARACERAHFQRVVVGGIAGGVV